MTREEEHLAEADRHIAEAEARIERQAALIDRLPAGSDDRIRAETLLETMESILVTMRRHRRLILAEIEGRL